MINYKKNSASASWWAQRVTAIALFPLVIWFAFFMFKAFESGTAELLTGLSSPLITIFLASFIAVGLYHGNLGIKEIIEDYIHCDVTKTWLMRFVQFFSLITALAGICAIITIHFSAFLN